MTSYSLNVAEAKEGSGRINSRIVEKGAYVGTFPVVKTSKNDKGTSLVEFQFKGQNGEQDRFVIYTHNAAGEALHGWKQLQALMVIFRLKNITSKVMPIEEYDFDTRQKVTRQAEVFPEMMNKPVGVVFVMEPYMGSKGAGKQAVFHAPFDPGTRQLAIEILDKKEAGNLDRMLAGLRDRPMRQQAAQASPQGETYTPPPTNFDEDIPF